jgi:3-phosphoshikimate 1-carboxyvinyltransferase
MQPLQDDLLSPLDLKIPGDVSSAAFLIVGALITPGSEILIRNVGLNHTRTGLIDVLKSMGAQITTLNHHERYNEPVGDLLVSSSVLVGIEVSGSQVTRMIDEFPAFSIAAAYANGRTQITDAEELRYKESDRITSIVTMLTGLGVQIEEVEDGFTVFGNRRPHGGIIQANRDHRLAMSMAICGLASNQQTTIQNSEIYRESYPGFIDTLTSLGASVSHD